MEALLELFLGGGSSIYAWLATLLTLVGSAFGLYIKGRADRARKGKMKQDANDLAAHGRMNRANTGEELSDSERRERLQSIADKLDGN